MTETARKVPANPSEVTIMSPIYSAKVAIDLMQHQLRQQVSKIARTMRDFAPGCIFTGKTAKPFAARAESPFPGVEVREASVDELESMLQLLTDV